MDVAVTAMATAVVRLATLVRIRARAVRPASLSLSSVVASAVDVVLRLLPRELTAKA